MTSSEPDSDDPLRETRPTLSEAVIEWLHSLTKEDVKSKLDIMAKVIYQLRFSLNVDDMIIIGADA